MGIEILIPIGIFLGGVVIATLLGGMAVNVMLSNEKGR